MSDNLCIQNCFSQFQEKKDCYKLEDDHLGSGSYGNVCTAKSLTTGKEYAVKVVDKKGDGHTRCMHEVHIIRMCRDHPNIVQLIEWFEDDKNFYIVLEKIYGGSLYNQIQKKGRFTEQETARVAGDIGSALKYLHNHGIAHRDVKPENILCKGIDCVLSVKLCDMGLASKPLSRKTLWDSVWTADCESMCQLQPGYSQPDLSSPVGSPEFLAPEIIDVFFGKAVKYDKGCDMWSLGVIVYIMLCGCPPFCGACERDNCRWKLGDGCSACITYLFRSIQNCAFDFPGEVWANVSHEAKDFICRLLVRNVPQRYTADDALCHPWIIRAYFVR